MNQNKNKLDEERFISSFLFIVSSPIFLGVLVLTFILGVSSIFGFFQNPDRLKLIINLINQKVFASDISATHHFPQTSNYHQTDIVANSSKKLQIIYKRDGFITASSLGEDRYSIFSKEFSQKVYKATEDRSLYLDYNVLQKSFESDLNSEMQLKKD